MGTLTTDAGRATLLAGPFKPKLLLWAFIDALRGDLGLKPSFIRAIGKPGEFAMLNTPSCHEGQFSPTRSSVIGG